MTEPKVHDEIEIERVAENLYNDAWSRSRNDWAKPWDEAHPETRADFIARAQRVLEGDLHLRADGMISQVLREIHVEEIPHVISVLMARWTQVVGSIPPLPDAALGGQQRAETVDYVGQLQDVDFVLTPPAEDATQVFVDIETPNGYSVAVGTWHPDKDGGSRLRIRVPMTDLTEDSQRRARRHG